MIMIIVYIIINDNDNDNSLYLSSAYHGPHTVLSNFHVLTEFLQ